MITSRSPIFVVGAPRSGTSLLAAMLGRSRHVATGPETHLYSKWPTERLTRTPIPLPRRRAMAKAAGVRIYDSNVLELYGVRTALLSKRIGSRLVGPGDVLDALGRWNAEQQGKSVWLEKTPNHLLYLNAIRRDFPEARIVRIIRDPRASALSLADLYWATDGYLTNCVTIGNWHRASCSFFANDDMSRTICFEDLVVDSHEVLSGLAEWIGIPFEDSMLGSDGASSVVAPGETWKHRVDQDIDQSRAHAWTTQVGENDRRLATVVLSDVLEALGYDGWREGPTARQFVVAPRFYVPPVGVEPVLRAAAQSAIDGRLGAGDVVVASAMDPEDADSLKRLRDVIGIACQVLPALAKGKRVLLPAQTRRSTAVRLNKSGLRSMAYAVGGGPVAKVDHALVRRKIDRLPLDRAYPYDYELAMLRFLGPGGVMLDVGANTGVYSVGLENIVDDVYLFEPIPHLAAALRTRFGADRVIELALSDTSGMTKLSVPVVSGRSILTRASLSEPDEHEQDGVETLQVRIDTLDNVVDSNGLDNVGLIKIDVEGHEGAVVRGAEATMRRDQPLLLVEIEARQHGGSIGEVVAIIEGLGYEGYFIRPDQGRLVSVADFSVQRDQDLERLRRREFHGYNNNFLFVPADRSDDVKARCQAFLDDHHNQPRRRR